MTTTAVDGRSTGNVGARDDLADSPDAELLALVRGGSSGAYAELYRRHLPAATRFARHLARSDAAADDLVGDSFTAVLTALQNGAGPTEAFRPYLLTAVRRRHWRGGRLAEDPVDPTDSDGTLDGAVSDPDGDDERLTLEAYRSLPERWQLVLWHTEVEGSTPAEVAPLVGLSPHATAALASRAREGLREAFLQAHLQSEPQSSCRFTVTHLGGLVRDNLSARDQAKVDAHLAGCARCQALRGELTDINQVMRLVIGPLVLGSGAAAYLARGSSSTSGATTVTAVPVDSVVSSGRRVIITVGMLSLGLGLLALGTDVGRGPQATDSVAARPVATAAADEPTATGSPATAAPSAGPAATTNTVALPGGVAVAGLASTACEAAGQVGAALTSTTNGTVTRALLLRGNPLGLPGPVAPVTPITGEARSTLSALVGTDPNLSPAATGRDACITVPMSVALISDPGDWSLLIAYRPDGADNLRFAVVQQPLEALGAITRSAVRDASGGVARALIALDPATAPLLSGLTPAPDDVEVPFDGPAPPAGEPPGSPLVIAPDIATGHQAPVSGPTVPAAPIVPTTVPATPVVPLPNLPLHP